MLMPARVDARLPGQTRDVVRLEDGCDESTVSVAKALVDQCREARRKSMPSVSAARSSV